MHVGFLETSHTGARIVHLAFYQDLSCLLNLDLLHTYLLSWIHPVWLLLLLQTLIEPQLLRATFGWPKKPFLFYLSRHFRGCSHLNGSWISFCALMSLLQKGPHSVAAPSIRSAESQPFMQGILLSAKYVASLAEMIWQGWNSVIRAKIWH